MLMLCRGPLVRVPVPCSAAVCCDVLMFQELRAVKPFLSDSAALSADCRELLMLLEFDATVLCAEWCGGMTRSGCWVQRCRVVSVATFHAATI